MTSLRGILVSLRQPPRPTAKQVSEAAACITEALGSSEDSQAFHISVSLCVNELAKHSSAVGAEQWQSLAERCRRLLPRMPPRQLTLLMNALAHSKAARGGWVADAAAALGAADVGSLSAQDSKQQQ
ncbi:unnamed protein product [Polarella glacialis]|uniref:Uncharacterized protein n=1 Tax=Polarella glacialis TaxID=89957 RepID=A0A813DN55_POLGL|nr:unnamed protein product [Polarella glacialis]CAE8623874.1 unnamed protein product [Polarella glacialis]